MSNFIVDPSKNSNSENRPYGLREIFEDVKPPTSGKHKLRMGIEPTKLYLDLHLDENLHSTFNLPWSTEHGSKITENLASPECYVGLWLYPKLTSRSRFEHYDDSTLFYIFYNAPRNLIQGAASMELCTRKWKYNSSNKLWYREQADDSGTMSWVVFDNVCWAVKPISRMPELNSFVSNETIKDHIEDSLRAHKNRRQSASSSHGNLQKLYDGGSNDNTTQQKTNANNTDLSGATNSPSAQVQQSFKHTNNANFRASEKKSLSFGLPNAVGNANLLHSGNISNSALDRDAATQSASLSGAEYLQMTNLHNYMNVKQNVSSSHQPYPYSGMIGNHVTGNTNATFTNPPQTMNPSSAINGCSISSSANNSIQNHYSRMAANYRMAPTVSNANPASRSTLQGHTNSSMFQNPSASINGGAMYPSVSNQVLPNGNFSHTSTYNNVPIAPAAASLHLQSLQHNMQSMPQQVPPTAGIPMNVNKWQFRSNRQ